ncbi:hypothetical protein NKG94_29515 [Micromonospora sp. M12]
MARCADGSEVDVYTITDMGHSWPGRSRVNSPRPPPGCPPPT